MTEISACTSSAWCCHTVGCASCISAVNPSVQRPPLTPTSLPCVIEVYSVSSDFEPVLEPDAAAWYNTGSRKDGGTMDATNQAAWETLTPEEKRRALYDRQVATLKTFLEHGVITQAQYDKSLHDLTEKMGYEDKH